MIVNEREASSISIKMGSCDYCGSSGNILGIESSRESSASSQLREISKQEQLLSDQLYRDGALDVRLVLSPALTPAWNVQVVDVGNPKMPVLSAILRQKRELSQQIVNEQGPIQTPFRNALGTVGPLFAIIFLGRALMEFAGTGRRDDTPQVAS